MKKHLFGFLFMMFNVVVSCTANTNANNTILGTATTKTIYDFSMKDIDGNDVSLSKYKGKIVVIVNTASQCGLVGQFAEIEDFYKSTMTNVIKAIDFLQKLK